LHRAAAMKHLFISTLLFATSAVAAMSPTDHHLMVKLGQGNTSEVDLAKIVEPKATNTEVNEFAQRMISDHSKAFEKLERIAGAEHVKLEGGMDAEHKEFAAKLAERKIGSSYDRTYMEEMVTDHRKDREDVKKALKEIKDPELKAWAEDALKTIDEHLRMAEKIEQKLR
jgi:putative membrane protein